jgi:hypothetical protein
MDRLQGRVVLTRHRKTNFAVQVEIGLTLASGLATRHAVVQTPQLLEVSIFIRSAASSQALRGYFIPQIFLYSSR